MQNYSRVCAQVDSISSQSATMKMNSGFGFACAWHKKVEQKIMKIMKNELRAAPFKSQVAENENFQF